MATQPHKQPPAPSITTTTTDNLTAPPPNLHLQPAPFGGGDDDDNDDFLKDGNNEDILLSEQGAGSRRPSTASLSRFRSCPQLASVINVSQDSPGCDMAPMTDSDGNMLHTTPVVNNNNSNNSNTLQVERPRFEMTSTPTPPSTPGSRRKDIMVSSLHSKTQSQSNGASPSSTPKLSRRSRMEQQNLIPRTVSTDSQGVDGAMSSSGRALTTENIMKLDELCLMDSISKRHSFYDDASQDDERASDPDDASSMHLCGRHSQGQYLQHSDHHAEHLNLHSPQQQLLYSGNEDDSVEKCNRWLQGLKLGKSDKIKSRSHIQLPAI